MEQLSVQAQSLLASQGAASSDYEKARVATEFAYGALIDRAQKSGLDVLPVMGLMYLPTQELTYEFQEACRKILMALTPPSTHIHGSDGQEHWQGESVD